MIYLSRVYVVYFKNFSYFDDFFRERKRMPGDSMVLGRRKRVWKECGATDTEPVNI